MYDPDYWKKKYQKLWSKSSMKEEYLQNMILNETGLELEPYGLGAGETEFISGSAQDNGHEKGSPDFKVKDKNIFIEITGPLNDRTKPQSGLWLRPDKLNYAYKNRNLADEFFALYFPSVNDWFVIHADQKFFTHVFQNKGKNDYFEVTPTIRGVQEKYIKISYENPFVKKIDKLISFLKDKH